MSEVVAPPVVQKDEVVVDGEDGDLEDFSDEDLGIVRQDSNYSKLSAESWLRVHSEYDDKDDGVDEDDVPNEGESESDNFFWNDIALRLREQPPSHRSVLECLVELLSGTGASKKRRFFMAAAEKRVWFSSDLRTIQWTSKKKGSGTLELSAVRVVRASAEDRTILIEMVDRKRTGLFMPTQQDLQLWIRCLACFCSLQAQVICPDFSVSEREDYDLSLDLWDNKPLRMLVQIDDYYILNRSDTPPSRAMLALSRGDKKCHGMKLLHPSIASSLTREELAVLKNLRHPNVLKYREFLQCKNKDGIYAVFDFMPRGVVVSGYKLESNKAIPEEMARRLINDFAAGLLYLHTHGIAHGAIRPDNLLFATDGSLKINPLGAILYDHSKRRKPLNISGDVTSPSYFAFSPPERCRDAKNAPKPPTEEYDTDTWSLGALLFFMLYGRAPFLAESPLGMQDQIVNAKLVFPESPRVSGKAKELIRRILGEKDARRRMKLEEILRHPWLTEVSGPFPGISLNPLRMFGRADTTRRKVQVTKADVEAALAAGKYTDPSTEDY